MSKSKKITNSYSFTRRQSHTLQVNETSTLLTLALLALLPGPRTEWVVVLLARAKARLLRELRRWHAGVLALQRLLLLSALAEKGVVACLCSFKTAHRACARGVDESAWCGVLCGQTHVADVAEGVLAFAAGEQGVEARLVRVLGVLLLEGWCLLLRLGRRGGEVCDWVGALVELVGSLLFLKAGEGGRFWCC